MTVTHVMAEADAVAVFLRYDHLSNAWMGDRRAPEFDHVGDDSKMVKPVKWIVTPEPLVCPTCPFDHGDLPSLRCPDCNGTGLPEIEILSMTPIPDKRDAVWTMNHGVVPIGPAVPIRGQHPTNPMIAEYLVAFEHCVQDWTMALGTDITDEFGAQSVTPGMWAHPVLQPEEGM